MKSYKIALVEAVSDKTHVYSRTYLPRLGIATMGAILNDLGYTCHIFVNPISTEDEKKLSLYDFVGIGSLSNTITQAYRLADRLKQKTTVIMGGPHVSFLPEECLDFCHYAVIGEGEKTLPKLIAALIAKQPVEGIKGLAFKKGSDEITYTGPAEAVDFENLPSPDFTCCPKKTAKTVPPILATSRGCPHNCSFCTVTKVFGRKYRFKTSAQVIEELQPIRHRSVCFADDNFCANPKRTKALLRDIMDANATPLRWAGQMCVDAAKDIELLELMQASRCRLMYVGIESVRPETLNKYGKAHHVEAIASCIRNLHKHNIGIHGMFVVNSDDPPEVAHEIVDFAIEHEIDTIQVFSITPFPGTQSFNENRDHIIHQEWSKYDGMHVVVEPKHCSAHEMQKTIIHQMQRFYSLRRVLSSYQKKRGWRMKYRLGGHLLLRKWINENRAYTNGLGR